MGNQPAADHRRFADQRQPRQCLQPTKHASPPPAGLQHGSHVDGRGAVSTVTAKHHCRRRRLGEPQQSFQMPPLLVSPQVWSRDVSRLPGEHLQEDNRRGPEVRSPHGEAQRTHLPLCRIPHQNPGGTEAVENPHYLPLCHRVSWSCFIPM